MRYKLTVIAAVLALVGCSGTPTTQSPARYSAGLVWTPSFGSSSATSIAFPAVNESATVTFIQSCNGNDCPVYLGDSSLLLFVLTASNTCTSFLVDAGKPMQPAIGHTVTALSPGSCVLTATPSYASQYQAIPVTVSLSGSP